MKVLKVDEPFSGGIFLTYKCTGECKHCMYACSPRWSADWIDLRDAEKILLELSERFKSYPPDFKTVGVNYGLHFTGGEPFMNFDLLLVLSRMAEALEIPATFVETNCFWCTSRRVCEEKLSKLRDAGLDGILVSVNPFILEHVPLERAALAIEVGKDVFGSNVLVYQQSFYERLRRLGVSGKLPLEETLRLLGPGAIEDLELLLMGRAPYKLGHLFRKYPAEEFFDTSCAAELTRGWHFHIDNYFNYITGYCGGLSIGDARELGSICEGVRLDEHPILSALMIGMEELYKFAVEEFGYEEAQDGYISKCHLCVDIRRHIVQQTDEFRELRPREFYSRLVSKAGGSF